MTRSIVSLARIAIAAALLCLLGPLSIPVGPVPISCGLLGVLLVARILGAKEGAFACLMYLLLGAAGVPVFSGFSGGLGVLTGPTGGYLIGYLPTVLISGWCFTRFEDRRILPLFGMLCGVAVLYACGTAWLAHVAGLTLRQALLAGVVPFLPFDCIKIILAAVLGGAIRRALQKTKLIP